LLALFRPVLAWSPILVRQIEIQALGFVLRRLQLNRHRETEVAAHRHPHAQLILYLSGEGVQTINGRRHPAQGGDLFLIPAGVPHGFALRGRSRPLCLVVDYEATGHGRRMVHRRLSPAALNGLHADLARLPAKGRLSLADYGAILGVVARLWEPQAAEPRTMTTSLYDRMRVLLAGPTTPGRAARAAGYHPDHLTRKLKREAGLGMRALRHRLRLESAETALRTCPTIAEAAARCGFEDPSYFTRWFRQQRGVAPSTWRQQRERSGRLPH
jgi:AraC-like DNA-binding protein/mannose-6-phosphate isomerase-like protein (cupin superfamily)